MLLKSAVLRAGWWENGVAAGVTVSSVDLVGNLNTELITRYMLLCRHISSHCPYAAVFHTGLQVQEAASAKTAQLVEKISGAVLFPLL